MARTQFWETSGGAGAEPVKWYGRCANFNFFMTTEVEDEWLKNSAGVTKQTNKVKEHSRRRFPGDPAPINVKEQPEGRQTLYKANKRSGAALPGYTIVLATNPDTYEGTPERRSFQVDGDWKEVIKYIESDAKIDVIVTTGRGASSVCKAAGGNEAQAARRG